MEQRVNVNFYVKLQKSPSETLKMLKTEYGESPGQRSHGYQSPISNNIDLFFDIRFIIRFEFVPERTTVDQTIHVEVLMPRGSSEESCGERSLTDSSPRQGAGIFCASSFAVFSRNIRRTLPYWLQLTSGCFQNPRVC
jgi:hypothetical protein